jgi:large subunit ribosomal protein L10
MSDVNTSKNRLKKVAIVEELEEKVGKAKGMIFTNYQGLTHHQLEALKRAVKKLEAEYVAAKNSLILRALEGKVDVESEKEKFTQPTATLFLYNDIIEPLKHLAKTIKELKLPVIKFGIIEGKIITDKEVVKLSTLPPIEILRAQLLGQMQSPISGLHRALRWNLQSLVMTLNAIKEKKT